MVRDACRLSLAEPSLVGPDLRYRWRGLAIRVLRRFGRAVADGSSEGIFRPVDPLVATRVLLALLLKHAEWRAPGSLFIEVSRDDETTLAELLDFFLRALRPEGITAWSSRHPGAPEWAGRSARVDSGRFLPRSRAWSARFEGGAEVSSHTASAAMPPAALGPAEFVERLGLLLEADGLSRIAGRMFGVLLLASEEVSLDDLAGRLEVSKASVSVNARLLEQRRLIDRVSRTGDRRDFYRTAPDLFRRSMEQRLARWRAVHEAVTAVRPAIARREAKVRRRLDDLDAAYEHVLGVVTDALDRWSLRGGGRAGDSRGPTAAAGRGRRKGLPPRVS